MGPIEAEICAAFAGLVDASKALDVQRYMAFIDREKFTGLGADGKAWHSFACLEDLITAGFAAVDTIVSLAFDRVKITVISPTAAILVNEYAQTLRLKDGTVVQLAGGGTQVWAKSDASWKLVSISASDAGNRDASLF